MSWSTLLQNAAELPNKYLTDGLLFGESPRYHDGKLYVSDMIGKKIYAIDIQTGQKEVLLDVPQQPNGMHLHPYGTLVYSSMFDAKLYQYNFETGESQLHADLSHVMTGYCGDMVIDKYGRVYIDDTGARVLHGEHGKPGRILIVENDGTVEVGPENIKFPNGIAIDSTGKVLYNAESNGHCLNAYDISATGKLGNRTDIWNISELSDATPQNAIDGICIDAEDGVWLSMLDYGAFVRRDKDGSITHYIECKGNPTACALGGEDGKTLFLVTNRWDEGTIFEAMVKEKTRCTVSTARVEIGAPKQFSEYRAKV